MTSQQQHNNVNITIFSRDRACQLEACIRSLKKHYKEYDAAKKTVIMYSSDQKFKDGYKLAAEMHPEFDFVVQTRFKHDVMNSVDDENCYTMFLVDDIVFKSDFSLYDDAFSMLKNNDHMLALSLRLHPKASYCYALDKNMAAPRFIRHVKNKFLVWQFYGADGDWGYGLSVDGNIYNTKFIKWMIDRIEFTNPNTLEAGLNSPQAMSGILPIYMCCYDGISKLLNNPANRVQNQFVNRVENSISSEELNDRFLKGEIISLSNITGIDNYSVHYPIDLKLEKR